MRRSGFTALLSRATAYPHAASAQQPADGAWLRAFRHCLRTTGHIEGERGRAVSRILFGCLLLSGAMAMSAAAQNAPGVTASEIKIGQTMPYTGPGAWISSIGLAEKAYMQMINDQGGINGRKINLISADDGFMPWRTGNETRKLIEVERVAFMFGSIGTPTQLEVARYLNERKIPQLFISERRLPLGQLQGDALHHRRHAPELSTGCASLYPIHSPAGAKSKNLPPP